MATDDRLLPEAVPPAARERVVERLSHHFANDELTEAALESRLQQVYAALSLQELDAIIADLPASPNAAPLPRAADPTATGMEIAALFGGQERKIVAVVPRALTLRARLGYVELDLTQATFEPGVTTIDARAFMGYVQIRFPAGVHVESAGRALFGLFTIKGAPQSPGANPTSVVRITGRATFGLTESFVGVDPDDDE